MTVLLYNLRASLTGMTDSVTISPATWCRIFLGKCEMKEYSEDSCYFVVKLTLSLIFGNGSTVKHQALVNSNFTRTNHVHWRKKNKKKVIDTNINVQIVQHNGGDTCNIMASLACKQGVGRGQVPVNDVIIRFSVYTTSWAFQLYQV